MRLRQTLAFLVFAICVLTVVVKSGATDARTGDWTIHKSDDPGKVEFSLIEHHHGGTSNHGSDWPTSSFRGVDFSKPGRQDVHFTVSRDAGKIECEGFLNDGEGAGIFHFQPDPNYAREMQSLGFSLDKSSEDDKQYSMAVLDVSLKFAREMKAENLSDLDADKLIAFRIHGVDSAFIEDLRRAGLKVSDSDKLIAFRIHGVTPQMISFLHQGGYSPDEDTLIAMRIHGATPEWMAALKNRGYDHVDLEKLIAFRIYGVSPEFIDQLVSMRIHGID